MWSIRNSFFFNFIEIFCSSTAAFFTTGFYFMCFPIATCGFTVEHFIICNLTGAVIVFHNQISIFIMAYCTLLCICFICKFSSCEYMIVMRFYFDCLMFGKRCIITVISRCSLICKICNFIPSANSAVFKFDIIFIERQLLSWIIILSTVYKIGNDVVCIIIDNFSIHSCLSIFYFIFGFVCRTFIQFFFSFGRTVFIGTIPSGFIMTIFGSINKNCFALFIENHIAVIICFYIRISIVQIRHIYRLFTPGMHNRLNFYNILIRASANLACISSFYLKVKVVRRNS